MALIFGPHCISIKLNSVVLDTKFYNMSVSPPQCTIKLLQRWERLARLFHGHVSGGSIVCMYRYTHVHTFTHVYFVHIGRSYSLFYICICLMLIFLLYFKLINFYNLYFIIKFWVASFWNNYFQNKDEQKKRVHIYFPGQWQWLEEWCVSAILWVQ